jgi:VPDSG-CTERM motif
MRISILKALAAIVIVLGVSSQAQALAISVSPSTTACPASPVCLLGSGNQTSTPDILAAIAALGATTEVYKQDVGAGSDSGTYASSYTTTFQNTPDDPSGFLIQYVSGQPVLTANPVYLLVEDGSATPAWYLFQINNTNAIVGWGGTANITGTNFWPAQGSISHVALYTGTSTVPDGGSMTMLLGIGLMGLAAVRRFLA